MRKSIPTQDARNRFPFTPEPKGAFSTEKKKRRKAKGEEMPTLPEIALTWHVQVLQRGRNKTKTSVYQ